MCKSALISFNFFCLIIAFLGPYPNVELSHVRVSDPFLKLEYILVVRNLPPMKFRDGLAGPFLPMETDVRENKC